MIAVTSQKTEPAGYAKTKFTPTETVNEHDCPPIVNAKLVVPLALGVPEISIESEPEPFDKVPKVKVAVRPVTPVEEIVCVEYEPPFPPM